MSDIKVSVVIPVYNRPTLVARCLDSVINQTMSHRDYEVIVVDDCSTDNTMEVLRDYERRYPDLVRTIKLDKNSGGASKPRNIGLDNARGKYVYFQDSDDTVIPETLQTGYDLAVRDDCDMVIVCLRTKGNWAFPSPLGSAKGLKKYRRRTNIGLNHIYKHSRIRELDLHVQEGMHGREDGLFKMSFVLRVPDLRWNILCDKSYYLVDDSRVSPDSGTITKWHTELFYHALIKYILVPVLTMNPPASKTQLDLAIDYTFTHIAWKHNSSLIKFAQDILAVDQVSVELNKQLPISADELFPPNLALYIKALRENNPKALVKYIEYNNKMKKMSDELDELKKDKSLVVLPQHSVIDKSIRPQTIHFISFMDYENTGDWACCALDYFGKFFENYICCVQTDSAIKWKDIYRNDIVIIGGGGRLSGGNYKRINKLLDVCNNVILWCAGTQIRSKSARSLIETVDFSKFAMIGIRDYQNPFDLPYVPCFTCMMPELHKKMDIKRRVGIIEHTSYPLEKLTYDRIKNDESIEVITDFIAESEVIITTSYHAAYWSMLMGKKVVVANAWASKFHYFRYPPAYIKQFDNEAVNSAIDASCVHPEFLEECIMLNLEYFAKIKSFVASTIKKSDSYATNIMIQKYIASLHHSKGHLNEKTNSRINILYTRIDELEQRVAKLDNCNNHTKRME